MKILKYLKLIWRNIVEMEEKRVAFFHNNSRLVNSKHYDRLFREFKDQGEFIFYNSESDLIYLKVNESIIVKTDSYYCVVSEVFVNKMYTLPLFISQNNFVVFDLGMNRGYASLFFANMENCKHVYGFEIDKATYCFAQENLSLNPELSKKISTYDFGLWDKDTIIDLGKDKFDSHTSVKEVKQTNLKTKFYKAEVKKSSSVLSEILKDIGEELKVLKIDVEGSEYVIFEDLYLNNVLQQFDLIMGEYHDGMQNLAEYFSDFICISKQPVDDKLGMFIYAKKDIMSKV